jgi:peptidoglycan/xylan/chitin deacetylase (PgdA/CDA1 family)
MRACLAGSVKTLLGKLVFGLGLSRWLLSGRAVVVAFHRVEAHAANDAMTMPASAFREWCRFFARHFRVVPLETVVATLERTEPFDRELAITFDDGYLDFQTQAVPILSSLAMTGTVFAVSDFVGADATPWWDEADRHPFMGWQELRDVAARGFTVGSHGKTHRGMDQLDPKEARDELASSKAALEAGLGRPVAFYAYPYGHPEHMPEAYRPLVGQSGYRACLGYGGLIEAGTSPFHIGRICVNDWFASPAQFGGYLVILVLRRIVSGFLRGRHATS